LLHKLLDRLLLCQQVYRLVATQVALSTVAMSTLNRFTGWLLHKLLGRLLLLCQQVYRLVATQVARSTVAMSTGLPAGCYTSCSVDCCYVNRFTGWLLHKLLGRLLLCQQVYRLVATQVARSTVAMSAGLPAGCYISC